MSSHDHLSSANNMFLNSTTQNQKAKKVSTNAIGGALVSVESSSPPPSMFNPISQAMKIFQQSNISKDNFHNSNINAVK